MTDTDASGYGSVDCLGWFDDISCTGHASLERREAFREHLRLTGTAGIAVEDNCAIELNGDEYRVLSASGEETAYSYKQVDGEVRENKVSEQHGFQPLAALF